MPSMQYLIVQLLWLFAFQRGAVAPQASSSRPTIIEEPVVTRSFVSLKDVKNPLTSGLQMHFIFFVYDEFNARTRIKN